MNQAILIDSEDWEGLFVNGVLVKEGHTLNEGTSRVKYFLQLAKQFNFNLEDMIEGYVTEEYEDYLYECGCFHKNINDVGYRIDD